jgi:hypothetical protein
MYTSMFRKAMLGDTATLALDFTTGTMPTAVTFTRADSTARATYIDASGYVKTVASAGAARFNYTGGVAKGLLIEAGATNLSNSVELWGTSLTTISTVSSQLTPANDSAVYKVTDNATNGQHSINRTPIISGGASGAVYTASVWMKKPSTNAHSYAGFQIAFGAGGGVVTTFNLATGANTQSFAYGGAATPTYTSTAYSNNWFRYTMTFTLPGVGSANIYILLSNDGTTTSYAGTGTDFYVWGAQVELGAAASSYILTTTAALTRLADDAVIRSTAWTSLFSKPGSLVVEYYRGEYGAGDRAVLAIDTAATKHIHLKHANASAASGIYNSAGTGVATKASGNASGLNKAAFTWSSANPSVIKYALNGNATVVSATSDIGATLGTWMTIGSASTTGESGSPTWEGYLNNSIKSVKYYSELLSDADMIAKTT